MPELPEVETVRRSLVPHLVGQRFDSVQVVETRLRWPVCVESLQRTVPGRRVLQIRRRSKYLLVDLEEAQVLLLHLGMSGRLSVVPQATPRATHDHVVWGLEDGRELRFNDPRRFGSVSVYPLAREADHPRLRCLGIEPLEGGLTGDWLFSRTRGKEKPIKNFLMDSAQIVGVGNIYACESLFAARIHPETAAGRLSRARCTRLAEAVRRTLGDAIRQGGTTLRDFQDADGSAGYFAIDLQVYGRAGEPCHACGSTLRRILQAGRSTFYCPRCQRQSSKSRTTSCTATRKSTA